MSLSTEFKEFAMRGNVVDLAVGVVIGGAFGKIVSSLVEAIIMPVIGVITSGNDFSKLAVQIGTNGKGEAVLLRYGAFAQSIVDFMIIAFVIFVVIRAINRLKQPAPAAAPVVAPSPPARRRKSRPALASEGRCNKSAWPPREATTGLASALSGASPRPARQTSSTRTNSASKPHTCFNSPRWPNCSATRKSSGIPPTIPLPATHSFSRSNLCLPGEPSNGDRSKSEPISLDSFHISLYAQPTNKSP